MRGASLPALLLAGVVLAGAAGCGGSSTPSRRKPASSGTSSTKPAAAAPAGGSEVAPGVVRASSGALTATLHASTHRPKVGAKWPISFTVRRSGAPVQAAVSYEYMLGGQVVARRSHYTFRGHFADVFRWPASAAGYPLTFRAVIESGGSTLYLDYPVRVRR